MGWSYALYITQSLTHLYSGATAHVLNTTERPRRHIRALKGCIDAALGAALWWVRRKIVGRYLSEYINCVST
jgi:hypothetical protein